MNKNILKIMLAQCLSRFGDNVEYIALCLLCYNMTQSVIPIGIISIMSSLPNIIFTLVGGAVSENSDKKKMMIICEFLRGTIILLVPLLRFVNRVEIIYIITFLVSTAESFFEPCCSSYISCSVKEDDYLKISGILNSAYQISSILGLTFGGIFVGFLGEYNAFFFDSATFYISAFVSLTILPCKIITTRKASDNIFSDIKEGLSSILNNNKIKMYLLMLIVISMLVSPIEPYVTEVMNHFGGALSSDFGLGLMFAILSVGVIIGNFVISFYEKKLSSKKTIVGVMFGISGIGIFLMSQNNIISLGIGILFVGITSGFLRTVCVASIMTSVEKNFRARTSSIIILITLCISPLATMAASICIESAHLDFFWLIEGILLILSFIASFVSS